VIKVLILYPRWNSSLVDLDEHSRTILALGFPGLSEIVVSMPYPPEVGAVIPADLMMRCLMMTYDQCRAVTWYNAYYKHPLYKEGPPITYDQIAACGSGHL
jgi:hypothetical protein